MEIIDKYEPTDKESGLEDFEQMHRVTCLECVLSKDHDEGEKLATRPKKSKLKPKIEDESE